MHVKGLSRRFSVRLLSQCLPTYSNIVKRIGEGDNTYGFVWGKAEDLQQCPCCGQGGVETVQHVLMHCPAGEAMRQGAVEEVTALWASMGHSRAWEEAGLLHTEGGNISGWAPWWGWAGMAPLVLATALQGLATEVSQHLLSGTAAILARYANARWK